MQITAATVAYHQMRFIEFKIFLRRLKLNGLIPERKLPHIVTKFGNSILKNLGVASEAIIKTGEKFVTKVAKY